MSVRIFEFKKHEVSKYLNITEEGTLWLIILGCVIPVVLSQ